MHLLVFALFSAPVSEVDCTPFAPPDHVYQQIEEHARTADATLIGEVHRRTAAPCVMIELSDRLTGEGYQVAFAFEEVLLPGVETAFAARDSEAVLEAIRSSDSWRVGPWDGRASIAWYTLLSHALDLIDTDRDRVTFLLEGRSVEQRSQTGKRDIMTANLIDALRRQNEDGMTLAIMGNNWTGNPVDSVCAAARREGYDILCLEVDDDPGRTCPAEGGAWRIGPPSRMRMVSPQDDPVDLVLLSPCERRSEIAARVFGIAEEPF